mmetsp:Transcript_79345/g.97039  ORF Transcript_79345/g.97039 Transcript_79345/m.97039 type:complete len:301 (-) Transcript_79345:257-1159(-)|eukprot:CAMPEP_0114653706 /NCGR_PEP_ID=MMETSP0191-20121206/9961_1 /TAXON_ID=126664 /ORGANISM="Sorites sp." /LENGTH=300 /DNA_ID=CAMNT_0001868887 /DNA_START=20 /DNA_END=922 /DNA_ORIENTATION=-
MGANSSHAPDVLQVQSPLQLKRTLPAHTPLLIFGDSWAEDNSELTSGPLAGVKGWPGQLADHLQLSVEGNFARGQAASSSLMQQLEAAKASLEGRDVWGKCLVVLHSGGNDFIGAEKNYNPFAPGNFWIPHVTFGFRKKALEVLTNLEAFLTALVELGCRQFLVSDLPFTSVVPALQIARLARVNKRGQWISKQMEMMLQDMQAASAARGQDIQIGHVREAELLNCLVRPLGNLCARCGLFVTDLFHPSTDLHGRMAQAIATTVNVERSKKDKEVEGEICDELNNQSPAKAVSASSLSTC